MPSLTERLALRSLTLTGWRSRYVRTSVGRMHLVEARGAGPHPPIVVLHGFGAASVNYVPLLRRLRQHGREVVGLDLPGHGFSETPLPALSIDTLRVGLVESLDRVIDERGEPVVLFGNSMGGAVVARYAIERKDRVRGVVLCSPGGAMMDPEALRSLLRTFDVRSHGDALVFVDRLLAEPTMLRHLIAWGVRRKFNEPQLRTLIESITEGDLFTPDELAALEVPALLIWGRSERILPRECLAFFRAHLPRHVRIEEPEGFGHTPHLERPGALTKHVLRFLESLDAPAD
jgi:pimeloyl-ACP methyl ester carboxylesterase